MTHRLPESGLPQWLTILIIGKFFGLAALVVTSTAVGNSGKHFLLKHWAFGIGLETLVSTGIALTLHCANSRKPQAIDVMQTAAQMMQNTALELQNSAQMMQTTASELHHTASDLSANVGIVSKQASQGIDTLQQIKLLLEGTNDKRSVGGTADTRNKSVPNSRVLSPQPSESDPWKEKESVATPAGSDNDIPDFFNVDVDWNIPTGDDESPDRHHN